MASDTKPRTKSTEDEKYKLQLLTRALGVLFAFSAKQPERGLDSLATELKLSKASLLRILRTLEAEKFLIRTGELYSLGPRVLELSNVYLSTLSVHGVAQPIMARLAEVCGQTVSLAILDDFDVVYIAIEHAQREVGIQGEIGGRHPAHATGLGKVLLADLEKLELEALLEGRVLERLTPQTIATTEALKKRLELVRKDGIAIDDEERGIGIRCVAAPIKDRSGRVTAAISLAGPIFHMTAEKMPAYKEHLLRAAGTISERLGNVVKDSAITS
jgi:DNA-binding IclR family transcriptional regulator